MNRILVTNAYLTKIKIKNNARCVFYNRDKETISHLFTECHTVENFWSKLNKNIALNIGIQYTASPFEILFGITSNINHKHTINILYLVAKSYIFKLFRSNGIISHEGFYKF